ncbi:MAG TPA: translation initiation factor IF-2, partial [bacterium]|nr:translation initiation factor IF-2 [bacterium]
ELGFDVGSRAIKINDKLAQEIIQSWGRLMDNYKKKKAYEKEKADAELQASGTMTDFPMQKNVRIPKIVTVKQFSDLLKLPLKDIINELMKNGILASMNERLDYDTAAIIATELGFEPELDVEDETIDTTNDEKLATIIASHKEGKSKARPPIIVVMGHVDHGKTRLLDTIRKTNVIDTEAGGITQHIGAYQVKKKNRVLTFIDTPGHEAFTAMRSRGAKIADIAILIVAADDGVKPQTVEAIKIIQQSNIPMIVAINKVDKPESNIEKVKQELTQYNVLPTEWGGKILMVPISAKFGQGVEELLDNILLIAEMEKEKLVATAEADAVGTIIESHVDKAIGPVATALVHSGTLHQGDHLILNEQYYGKIKAMRDHTGKNIEEAGPSVPAQIIGLKSAPIIGDIVESRKEIDKKTLKNKIDRKSNEGKFMGSSSMANVDIGNSDLKKLNIIIRADVLGSLEAIVESLSKIDSKEIKANIIQQGLGNITESDIWQAQAGNALILGFHVQLPNNLKLLAEEQKVPIQNFKIIYDLIAFIRKKMEESLGDEIIKEELGKAEVLAIFKKEKNTLVVGCKIKEGKIIYQGDINTTIKANILRNGTFVTEGKIIGLKVGKEDVTEVQKNQECGVQIANAPEIAVADILEIYLEKRKKKILK